MSDTEAEEARLILLTADIVSAYVSNNHVQGSDLPRLLGEVHAAIHKVSAPPAPADAAPAKATSQEIRRSISHDVLISFEDGKPYKTLRRHLTLRGLSPEQYRAKWGLPPDYPMTSASYSEQRSELARALGLGQKRRRGAPLTAPEPAVAVAPEEASAAPPPPEKKRRTARKKVGA